MVAVGFGGMIGASLRYSLSLVLNGLGFLPLGTLFVNLFGCFLLTFFSQRFIYLKQYSSVLFTGITVGCIGAFTTFSTITVEIVQLIEQNFFFGITYVALTFFGGLLACYIGYLLGYRGGTVK